MPRRKREKAKSAFDSEKRRSEAAAFFISVKGIDRGNKAVRVDYSAKEKKGSTKKLRVLMAVLAVVMVGVISAGGYLIYQEFLKLGPPSQPVSASAASSGEDSGSSVPPVDPNDRLLVVGNSKTSLPDTFALDLQEYEGIPVDSQLLIQLKSMVRAAAAENVTLQVEQGYVAEEALQKNFDDTVSRLVSEGRSKAKAEAEALKTTLPAGKNEWSTGLLIRFANLAAGIFLIPTPTSGSATTVWITALSSAIPKIKRKSPELRRLSRRYSVLLEWKMRKKCGPWPFAWRNTPITSRSKRQAINPVRFRRDPAGPREGPPEGSIKQMSARRLCFSKKSHITAKASSAFVFCVPNRCGLLPPRRPDDDDP